MQPVAYTIPVRSVFLTVTNVVAIVQCFAVFFDDQYSIRTTFNHSKFPEDFVFLNSTTVGVHRRGTGLLYPINGIAAVHINNNLVVKNTNESIIYTVREFEPTRLNFDGDQLALWDRQRLIALLLLPGWPRVDTRGRAEIIAYNATNVRSEIFIQGAPSYNGSHILLTANNVLTAYYKSEGFPVINNHSVTIVDRNFNVSNQMISKSKVNIKGQISQCHLRHVEVKRDLVTLFNNSQHTCTTISPAHDIVLQAIANTHILLLDEDSSGLVRLDLIVTKIKHNGTSISLETTEGVTVDSPTSGMIMIKSRNTVVSIQNSHSVSVIAELPLHPGVFHNGTHLVLGDAAIFYAPGRPSLRVGIVDIVTNEGAVSATVEVSSRVLIKEGLIHLNDTRDRGAATFTAQGVPHVTKGNLIIQHEEQITANVSHGFTSTYFNGLQLQLLNGTEVVIVAHAEGSAILNNSELCVIKDGKNLEASIETSLFIEVSPKKITFAKTATKKMVVVARQGNLVYNGTHLYDVDTEGIHRLVVEIKGAPHISETGITFGEQNNCSTPPCLVMSIAGSFLYNSSTILVSSSIDRLLLKANASLVTIAKGALRFISHYGNELLASALYADAPAVYLRSDSAELLPLHESCSSALVSSRTLADHGHNVVISTNGQERWYNGSHMIVVDKETAQTLVMEAAGYLTVDTVGRSGCIAGGDSRRLVHLVFDIGSDTSLASGRIVMNADGVTYNMSVPGLPVYNGSHVNIHDGDTVSASVIVSSFATLLNRTLFFTSENGRTLLEAHVTETNVITLSNGSLVVGGSAKESLSFRLSLGQAHAQYFGTHIDFISVTNTSLISINYSTGFARVNKKETIVESPQHNITLDIQGVPRLSNGLFSFSSKMLTFSSSVPNANLSCSVAECILEGPNNAVVLIDTDGATPIFSEGLLTLQESPDTDPLLVADVDGELYLNGTMITSPTAAYEFKGKVGIVCSGTDVLLSTSDGQLPSAKVKDINYINVTSSGVVFSNGQVRRLVLPPLNSVFIRTAVNDSANAFTLGSNDYIEIEVASTGPVQVTASLSGNMVLVPRKALNILAKSSQQSVYVDGLGFFTFGNGKLSVEAATTNVSVDCSRAVPHFSNSRVDLITQSGARILEIKTSLAVPRYNCSHIVLVNIGNDSQSLGLFEVYNADLHYNATTGKLFLIGIETGDLLATIADAWSMTIRQGILTARLSDDDRATAHLCAPGEVHFSDGVLRLQSASGRNLTQFAISNSSSLTFKNSTAVFTGHTFNLTLQFTEKTVVVRPGKSVSIEGAHFEVAGIPVDNGAGRLRLYAKNGTALSSIVASGFSIADIAYSGMPLFINGTVVYADSNDPSRSVVVQNTGNPYVYLRAKDTDSLLQSGALSNGTAAQSWIVARPDNESVGALRLLQNSNRLGFNGTHLVVYDGDNNITTAEPVTVIALLAKRVPIADGLCIQSSSPTQATESDATTSGAATESRDTIPGHSIADSTQANEDSVPLVTISTFAELRDSEQTKPTVDLPETSPDFCDLSAASTSVLPVLTADCVLHFLENGQSLVASVQLPHGCRLSVSQSGNISIEDDSGVLAMSFEHAQGDAVTIFGGTANVSGVDGRLLLNAHYGHDVLHVLDGKSLKVLRPDGSVAMALEQSSSFNSSGHGGTLVAPPRAGGSGRPAVDLSLQADGLTALVNGTNVALFDQYGTLKALLIGAPRLDVNNGMLIVEKPLSVLPPPTSDSETPSPQSEKPTTLAAIDLSGGSNLVPVFNGSHLMVIDPADGIVRAVISKPLSASNNSVQSSNDVIYAMLENSPRWRLFVPGTVNLSSSEELENVTKTVISFSRHDGAATHSELLFGNRESALSSDDPDQPLQLENDAGKRPIWLRVNASLLIVDGMHLEYRLPDGAVVARVNFISANDSQDDSWYSTFNDTHIVIRSSEGEVLSMISVRGTPSLSKDATFLCPQSRPTANVNVTVLEASTAESILPNEPVNHSSSFEATTVSEASTDITPQALVFRTASSEPEVIVCLPPEISAFTNESLDYWVFGSDSEGKRYVVPKPSVRGSATKSEVMTSTDVTAVGSSSAPSSGGSFLTADPNTSITGAPALGNIDSRFPVPPYGRPVVSGNVGGSGTLATRFAFIVMLTVCAMFLLGAVIMYAIMNWMNREHDYIVPRQR